MWSSWSLELAKESIGGFIGFLKSVFFDIFSKIL